MNAVILDSGSKGNCILLQGSTGTLVLDCGLSASKILNLMPVHGIDPLGIKGILITHEHGDHVDGLERLMSRTGAPLYCSRKTAAELGLEAQPMEVSSATRINSHIAITPFLVPHDAVDPWGFVIEMDGVKVGYCADAGRVTVHMGESLQGVQLLFLESNYDPETLKTCAHHDCVKWRVASDRGHLSNFEAANLVEYLGGYGLKRVVLCHLSKESNNPQMAISTVMKQARGIQVEAGEPGLKIVL